ncbi:tRNA synthetases class I-domain-containing protein [Thelephora terrestris]|uniref:isoleucine--tRNA ligase n=1 Tax=Thelephora terrestris TaxID=56493 RepID=A0A9P6HIV4_9AGAM|nr:tRNA synthetases class I-domain-containing protein [Thelephora terrestris]
MQVNYVHFTRHVYGYLNRTFSHTSFVRFGSTSAKDVKKYSDTLLLPKTTLPMRHDAAVVERTFADRTGPHLYRWQSEHLDGPLFVLHDGPPYANGRLHMGHALNKIIKDVINRFNVLLGRKVHYVPGWDCHGLPIEIKALAALRADPHTLAPTTIRDKAREFAIQEVAAQKEEFRSLGIMADWDNEQATYRTLDSQYEMRQLRIFQKMVDRGLVYRQHKPVYYSPSSRSALAEAELVYQDNHVSHSAYVCFELDTQGTLKPAVEILIKHYEQVRLLIWTTTPWTLSANMGIAVNPTMTYSFVESQNLPGLTIVAEERLDALADILGHYTTIGKAQGSDLAGSCYLSPFAVEASRPVIPSNHVTAESGTGLVHCAPAHGAEDYHAFLSWDLECFKSGLLCHVDGEGKFTDDIAEVVGDSATKELAGQDIMKAGSRSMLGLLEAAGALVKVQRVRHRYPYDWKTGEPVITLATSQWFANLGDIKEAALNALTGVQFYPEVSRNRLTSFVRSRSEWCISRQRAWGVPIPALYHVPTDRAVLDSRSVDHVLSILDSKGVDYWWNGPVDEFVPPHLRKDGVSLSLEWRKGTDTMDVWFDSGTSWSMLGGLRSGGEALADVCVEGSDQHRGWFQSQLLTFIGSLHADEQTKAPYRTLITHGMVLDESGKKMSKSLGNIIRPETIIRGGKDLKREPAYGADVLRLWAASVDFGTDSPLSKTALGQSAEVLRKIRNSARFILGNIGDAPSRSDFDPVSWELLGPIERYVMTELRQLEEIVLENYKSHDFAKVVTALSNFASTTLSSLYFDITKDTLYADTPGSIQRRSVVTVLEKILDSLTSLIAPIAPHLAEEIHHHAHGGGEDAAPCGSVFTKKWQPLGRSDPENSLDVKSALAVRRKVMLLLEQARENKRLRNSLEAGIDLLLPPGGESKWRELDVLQRDPAVLKALSVVSDVRVLDEAAFRNSRHESEWEYTATLHPPSGCPSEGEVPKSVDIPADAIGIRVRPALLSKCPRCWTFTREEHADLCARCDVAVHVPK